MRRRLQLKLKGLVTLVLSVWLHGRSGLTNGALVWAVCRCLCGEYAADVV